MSKYLHEFMLCIHLKKKSMDSEKDYYYKYRGSLLNLGQEEQWNNRIMQNCYLQIFFVWVPNKVFCYSRSQAYCS